MSAYIGDVVKNGLVLYLDAANSKSYVSGSNTWFDLSGNGNNGTLTNGPTFSSDRKGIITFDGVNDYVTVAHSTSIVPTDQITISSWVNTDWQTTNSVRILSKTQAGGWQLSINDAPTANQVGMTIHIGGSYRYATVDKSTITSGYHHIVGTFDGRFVKLYIDSSLVVNTDLGSTLSLTYSTNNHLVIGAEPGTGTAIDGYYINANIAQVSIYNRALSSAEILENYNSTKGRFDTPRAINSVQPRLVTNGLVMCLDAGNRESYVSGSSTIFDLSGNGYNGTLTNGPTFNSSNNGSIVLDGTNDFISGSSFTPNITNKTLAAWVKLSSVSQQGGGVINLESDGGGFFDAIVYNETNSGWGFGSNNFNRTSWSGIKETSTSDWIFIAATYANNNYNLYRNSVLILNTTSFPVANFNFSSKSLIGARHTGGSSNYLSASIAFAQIYNRALSAAEILQNYNALKGRFGL